MTVAAEQSTDLPGFTVFFPLGEDHRIEPAVAALKRLGIRRLRVPLAVDPARPDPTHLDEDSAEWAGALLPLGHCRV